MSRTSTETVCPATPHWRRLLAGQIDAEERRGLERHLDTCPACREVVQGLRAETPDPHRLVPQPDTEVGSGAVPSGRSPSSLLRGVEATPPRFAFLSPPTEPGDLGWLSFYRIRRVLGEGGMGIVFEAEDTHLQRRTALKVMKPDVAANQASRERFLQEARTAAKLSHDNVITIYQVGVENDVPFLSMQYLHGESLEERLQREGRLPILDVLRIGREVASGLAAAHDKGLIHRDVKPANLWLEELPGPPGSSAPRWRVKILDFGLARPMEGGKRLTASGFIVGTPHYLAPEQARDLPLDGRCDLFSLGIVLYRCLCGALPFAGTDPLSVLTALAGQEPRPVGEMAPDVPPALAAFIHRLLAKDPADRPPSGHEVVAELEILERSLTRDEATLPTPVPSGPRKALPPAPRPPSRRRPRWAVALAVLAVFLAAGGLLWHHMGRREPDSGPTPAPVAENEPIKFGVLFSQSGPLRDSGRAAIEAALLAIDELNDKGGVLGRRVQSVVADGESDPDVFAVQAEKLLSREDVRAILGCWTSAARRAVVPVIQKHDSLLLYPVQYEGLEQSPVVFYLGAAPNQQILPAIRTALTTLKRRRLFLVGTDSVYPHAVNAMIRDVVAEEPAARVVGEMYLPPSSLDPQKAIAEIKKSNPDFIVDTLNGDTELSFPRALRKAGIFADQAPILFFDIPEYELRGRNGSSVVGDYVACNYFESVDRPENRAFVEKFRARYGLDRAISDSMENCYVGVQLWAKAVQKAGTPDPPLVRRALRGLEIEAPAGAIRIDPQTQHTYNVVRMAHILRGGRLEIIASTEQARPPVPYPPSRTPAEWDRFLEGLYKGWGGHCEAPP